MNSISETSISETSISKASISKASSLNKKIIRGSYDIKKIQEEFNRYNYFTQNKEDKEYKIRRIEDTINNYNNKLIYMNDSDKKNIILKRLKNIIKTLNDIKYNEFQNKIKLGNNYNDKVF